MTLTLHRDVLTFDFTDLHPDAALRVTFQRTLRVPDDGRTHYLPPGLGAFPVRAVDDLPPASVPAAWKRRGGVALPMWQGEACWLNFSSPNGYPFLVKVAAGKINAVNGEAWKNEPDFREQDFLEVPTQPWLDGFNVGNGVVRQFVAMPLGQGYTAEEQLTGKAEHGGVQLLVHPLKPGIWRSRQQRRAKERELLGDVMFCMSAPCDMGLAPGGSIRQEIAKAVEKPAAWDLTSRGRCFVHIAQAEAWEELTGSVPPHRPPSAADYTRAGLPWFDWYDGAAARTGHTRLGSLASIKTLAEETDENPLGLDEGFEPPEPIRLRPGRKTKLDMLF